MKWELSICASFLISLVRRVLDGQGAFYRYFRYLRRCQKSVMSTVLNSIWAALHNNSSEVEKTGSWWKLKWRELLLFQLECDLASKTSKTLPAASCVKSSLFSTLHLMQKRSLWEQSFIWHCAKVRNSTWKGNHLVKFKCHLRQHKYFIGSCLSVDSA